MKALTSRHDNAQSCNNKFLKSCSGEQIEVLDQPFGLSQVPNQPWKSRKKKESDVARLASNYMEHIGHSKIRERITTNRRAKRKKKGDFKNSISILSLVEEIEPKLTFWTVRAVIRAVTRWTTRPTHLSRFDGSLKEEKLQEQLGFLKIVFLISFNLCWPLSELGLITMTGIFDTEAWLKRGKAF